MHRHPIFFRNPNVIKKQPPKVKKAIAAGLVAGSLAITGGIYSLIPNNKHLDVQPSQGIEQIVSSEIVNQNINWENISGEF